MRNDQKQHKHWTLLTAAFPDKTIVCELQPSFETVVHVGDRLFDARALNTLITKAYIRCYRGMQYRLTEKGKQKAVQLMKNAE